MPIIPVLGRLQDLKFEAILSYIVRLSQDRSLVEGLLFIHEAVKCIVSQKTNGIKSHFQS